MFEFLFQNGNNSVLVDSKLFDESTFYKKFLDDLRNSKANVLIESPYITSSRMDILFPFLQKLVNKGVKVSLITRDPTEHDDVMKYQATEEILRCVEAGIKVTLLRGNHHRKIAIIDDTILWEGSLNILSQCFSQEIMRRSQDKWVVDEMINFLHLKKYI